MINHSELLEMWEKDAEIDRNNLDVSSVEVPKLHHKYLQVLMDLRSRKIALNNKVEEIRKNKELYYSGQATADQYKEKPFDVRLKTKAGVEKHVNTDPEVVRIQERIEYIDVLIEGVNHILTQIQWRNQHIKNALDWARFTSGSL